MDTNKIDLAKAAELIKIAAFNLWIEVLREGNEKYLELKNPKPGDLVMETSTLRRLRDPLQGIGRLISVTEEPMYTEEEWRESGGAIGEPVPKETVYKISLVFDDCRECRWTNAMFIKVKEDIFSMFRQ